MAGGGERERWSVRARARSFGHAGRGIAALLATQHNAWIHAAMTAGVVALAAVLGVSRLEWALLALAVALVWAAEAMNTAVEALGDRVSPEHHPLVERAKDVAAGGVLLAAVGSAVAGLLVLGPRLLALVTG